MKYRLYFCKTSASITIFTQVIKGELKSLTKQALSENYVDIYTGKQDNESLEIIFEQFNSPETPLGTDVYQQKIRKDGTHTSMSVGDIVEVIEAMDEEKKGLWIVASIGFQKISLSA